MGKNVVTRRDLLDRWRSIEAEDSDDDGGCGNDHKRRRLRQLKETWFSDAFNFLIELPNDQHIWCGQRDVMGPLLETFYNYSKDDPCDSPLKILWSRLHEEMQFCTQCICQHHQTQQTYATDYESASIGPLLQVLRTLDEERICDNLKEINAKLSRGGYDPSSDNAKVVSIMFEVLMFPCLLDDQLLADEFEIFIDAIDNCHELTLVGQQQYPGVYALLFLKSRRARSIGYRLAGQMGKLRRSEDLDPLQPLLKKYIAFLETEIVPSPAATARPRVQLERITVWLGIKALLGFLEPPAFEEGILDRYPVFLSIVLNHITDDSLEFSYAVKCLRLLFEMLGCKLWLRSSLSPSVMRNTLLGQCFHTRDEKSHKEIFDLFEPFLQSLEALQDGDFEEQRRQIIYFLLHQVTVSSNFSLLMRKKACQISLLIVHRGYKMNPTCPPYECAHMWGPSLISSLRDSSLHISLRQPAFDLIQTVIVSDASVLVGAILHDRLGLHNEGVIHTLCTDDNNDDEEICLSDAITEKTTSCWNEFRSQSKITSLRYGDWLCIPMLWFDVLVGIDPLILPVSFSKAVFWGLSRFSMVEAENSVEMVNSTEDLMATCASEILHVIGWKVPSGSDDAGNGKESKNSVSASKLHMPLIRTFRKLASHFIVCMEQGELRKQWTWDPMMAESLILLLLDPNDDDRKVTRHILEQFSGEKGLSCGLQFLCSSQSSLQAVFLGLSHALELVVLDSVLLKFEKLHHFFFVLWKLIKEGNVSAQPTAGSSPGSFSSQGGFLRQLDFDLTLHDSCTPLFSSKLWEHFSGLISERAWPSLQKCLAEGIAFRDNKTCQMTLIRVLEILPLIFEKLCENPASMMKIVNDMTWLQDLMNWGRSSLAVVARYWKQTLASILGLLKKSFSDLSAPAISALEELISPDNAAVERMCDQVAHLCVSLKDEGSFVQNSRPVSSFSKKMLEGKIFFVEDVVPFSSKVSEMHVIDLEKSDAKNKEKSLCTNKNNVIILPDDDEDEQAVSASEELPSRLGSSGLSCDDQGLSPDSTRKGLSSDKENDTATYAKSSKTLCEESSHGFCVPTTEQPGSDKIDGILRRGGRKDRHDSKYSRNKSSPEQDSELDTADGSSVSEIVAGSVGQRPLEMKTSFDTASNHKSEHPENVCKVSGHSKVVHNEVPLEREDDSWEFSFFKSARPHKSLFAKPCHPGVKRQVIQLNIPNENRSWRTNSELRRFKGPRLDDWYKPILELDYFVTVGLASSYKDSERTACKLKEVPVSFKSPEEYVEVFQPLVLEEFKAQLRNSLQEMTSMDIMDYGGLSILSVERIDDFHIVRCAHEDTDPAGYRILMENDLILLTKKPLSQLNHDVHMVGKVERRETDTKRMLNIVNIRLYLKHGCARFNRARKSLVERSKWCISRLMSITPQLREFQALSSLREIPLVPVILDPSSCPGRVHNSRRENLNKTPRALQQVLKSSYNASQLQAISAATGSFNLEQDFDLTLIQGPPGTGKTRTILAIVSGLLALLQMRNEKRKASCDPYSSAVSSTCPRLQINQATAIARAWQDAALAKQINEDERRNLKSTGSSVRGRILICAHSNAAVDELVSRISTEGLYDCNGMIYKPYLVRVGNAKTVHPNSLPFFIDTLVDHHLAEERVKVGMDETVLNSVSTLRSNLESIVDRIRLYEARRANLRDGDLENSQGEEIKESTDAEIAAKLRVLYEKKKVTYKDLSHAQDRERKANDEHNAFKQKLRRTILKEAEIVVTTLSGCGGDLYGVCAESVSSHKFSGSSESALFDAVLVDEAAQALEPATLIPLQLLKSKGTRCIMVGDPKQLPATVISNIATKYLFQCSMFERLQRAGHPVFMLTHQYRMHPEICRFPSLHFYDGKLRNGDLTSSKAAAFHENEDLGPYLFFDVTDGKENLSKNSGSQSLCNECEADAAVEVIRFFKKRYPLEFVGGRIGVITPYRSQLSVLRSRFSAAFGSSILVDIEFNTVDGFQGREVDILILSTVRAAEPCSERKTMPRTSNIGFVADVRRMNVALTRAKISLWVFGNARTLQTNENWASLLRDAKDRNLVREMTKPYKFFFKSVSNEVPAVEFPVKELRKSKLVEKVQITGKHAEVGRVNAILKKKIVVATGEKPVDEDAENAAKCRKRGVNDIEPALPVESVVFQNGGNQRSGQQKSPVRGSLISNHGNTRRRTREMTDMITEKLKGKSSNDPVLFEKLKGANRQFLDSASSGRCLEQLKQEKRKPVTAPVLTSSGRVLKMTGGKDLEESSGPAGHLKDKIAKRKHQRDAVDALLSSALISSKKRESSIKSLPAARPRSPAGDISDENRAIRPPKQRRELLDTSSMQVPDLEGSEICGSADLQCLQRAWNHFADSFFSVITAQITNFASTHHASST
ncbi:OLC1v1015339C1 [Oldenlandia corymbosa var. corymbosa]|uniref:OLC1v1015339C1 n=1 Tax=Oldenlandia corymbosa var. corymbosa TaxID=529605 RepID=A0AAV1E373_OLDCO|nr:OLC1v1015339C1 [Oldenlandia corymbosa var. corymbosa]